MKTKWRTYSGIANSVRFNSKIFLTAILSFNIGCSADQYRSSLVPKSKGQVETGIHGSYTTLNINTENGLIGTSGELLAFQFDSIYLQTEYELQIYSINDLESASIILVENSSKSYGRLSLIAAIPGAIGMIIHPDYAGGFATLTIAPLVFGGLATLGEASRKPHIIQYPSSDLPDFSEAYIYARFPAGLPPDYNRNQIVRSY